MLRLKLHNALGIACLAVTGLLPAVANSQFVFTTNNGAITITSYTGSGGVVTIPETTNGWPVVKIGNGAFSNKVNVASVVIPNATTEIGTNAFYACVGLTNVSLGSSLLSLGPGAFYGCKLLTSVAMPDTVQNLGSNVFNQCSSLTNVLLSGAVTNLGASLFQACSNLASLLIPQSVVAVGNNAFARCVRLTNATLSANLRSIGTSAFTGCERLPGIVVPDSVTNLGFGAYSGCLALKTAVIGNRVPYLSGTFNKCTALQDVSIGTNVAGISLAFGDCGNLPTLFVPASVTNLSSTDFRGCTNLLSINIAPDNPVYASVDGVVFNKSQTTLLKFPGGKPGSYAVADTVKRFSYGAFWECFALTNLWIGAGVTNMDYVPFDGSMVLQTIEVSPLNDFFSSQDGVLFDKNRTTLLRFPPIHSASYVVPAGTTALADEAFVFSAFLTNVVIPATMQRLSNSVFSFCPLLTTLAFEGDAPALVSPYIFSGSANVTVYFLPGTAGWLPSYAQAPTAVWYRPHPTILSSGPSFGVQANNFGFAISWATNGSVAVDACTNLFSPSWQPVQTNSLANGIAYFQDVQWTNYPRRFYRARFIPP